MRQQFLLLCLVLTFCVASLIWQNRPRFEEPFLNFPIDLIQGFELRSFDRGLSFQKDQNNQWQVRKIQTEVLKKIATAENLPPEFTQDQPIKTDLMRIWWQSWSRQKISDFSAKADDLNKYQISSVSLQVEFFDALGNSLEAVSIGKQRQDSFECFAKKGSENKIRLIHAQIRQLALYPYEDWVYKGPDEQN